MPDRHPTSRQPFRQFQYPTVPLCVSSDFRTRSLRAALDRAIGPLSLDIGKEGRS